MSYKKGIAIGQAMMQIGDTVQQGIDRQNAQQDEADYSTYMKMIQSGKNPEEELMKSAEPAAGGLPGAESNLSSEGNPAEATATSPEMGGGAEKPSFGSRVSKAMGLRQKGEINHRALMKAYTDDYKLKMQDVTFRKSQMALSAAKAKQAKMGAQTSLESMDGALTQGNEALAKEHFADAYTYINNGDEIQYDRESDKFFEMDESDDGQLVRGKEVPFMGWGAARKLSKGIMEGSQFEQTYMQNDWKNKVANLNAANTMERVVDKDGRFVGFMAKQNDDGRPAWNMSLNSTPGVDMKWHEALKEGYRLEKDYISAEAKEAGLAEIKSKTKSRDSETVKKQGPKSTEGKLVNDLMIAMPNRFRNADEAMKFVLQGKNAKSTQSALAYANEQGLVGEERRQYIEKSIPDLPDPYENQTRAGSMTNEAQRLTELEKGAKDTATDKGVPVEAIDKASTKQQAAGITGGDGDADREETRAEKGIKAAEKVFKKLEQQIKAGKKNVNNAATEYYKALRRQHVDEQSAKDMVRAKFGNL
ncbi:MAG: hypothetical protein ACYS32_00605 [Planctomycetota bacterium]|jgi:hypothetical protein